jgi:hypothetical protein
MIKFFRKIRQNLLMENKTGKYFKYAIGEIILVVIGILIALQINNWNNKRIAIVNENELILNIIEDLTYDHIIISRLLQQARLKQQIHLQIYKESIAETEMANKEPLSSKIVETIDLISKTWDNHKDVAQKISERQIRNDINKYFSNYQITTKHVENLNGTVLNELRHFTRNNEMLNFNVIFKSNPHEDDIDSKRLFYSDKFRAQFGTKEFNSILVELYLATQDVTQWLETLLENNELLRSKLNKTSD